MKKFRVMMLSFVVVSAMMLSGCATAMSPLGYALVTTVDTPSAVTSNKIGSKTGQAVCQNILGIIAMGDCSLTNIAKTNGITTISTVDTKIENYIGLYAKYTVTITGE